MTPAAVHVKPSVRHFAISFSKLSIFAAIACYYTLSVSPYLLLCALFHVMYAIRPRFLVQHSKNVGRTPDVKFAAKRSDGNFETMQSPLILPQINSHRRRLELYYFRPSSSARFDRLLRGKMGQGPFSAGPFEGIRKREGH